VVTVVLVGLLVVQHAQRPGPGRSLGGP
jgi:hypothetical protein